jgi:hypothetical protein
MDYLEQVVAFHQWKEVNPLPASAIALWHELMAVCNKAGWPEEFTVKSALLQANAGLSRKEFDRARQILTDLGRIGYKKSGRVNMAGKYSVIPFPIVQKGQQEGQREGHRTEHRRDNRRDNYKDLKELKDLKSSSSASSAGDGVESLTTEKPETLYQAHERVFGFGFSNPMQAQRLGSYLDDGMEEAVLIRALERAALASTGYSFPLIDRIVKDYFAVGAMDIESAKALDAAHDAQKQQKVQQQTSRPASGGNRQQKSLSLLEQMAEEERKREQVTDD